MLNLGHRSPTPSFSWLAVLYSTASDEKLGVGLGTRLQESRMELEMENAHATSATVGQSIQL